MNSESLRMGPPASAAELMLVNHRHRGREEVARVESVVAKKLPGRAVKLIRAGFRSHQHLRAGIVPVLGREIVRQNANLVDGIRRRIVDRRYCAKDC